MHRRAGTVGSVITSFSRLAPKHQHTGKRRKSDAESSTTTQKRRKREDSTHGRIDEYSADVRTSFATAMRTGRRAYEQRGRDDHAAALAAHRARDKKTVQEGLLRLVKLYLKAKKAFAVAPIVSDATVVGRTQLRTLESRLDANLSQQRSDAVRARVLKEQIERAGAT